MLKSCLQDSCATDLQYVCLIGTQEVCGPRSSDDVFLKCLVKTRQWQDTQIHNRSDCKPWLAYYRTLCRLDAELSRSKAITVIQGEGFRHKVLQWVDECRQSTRLAVLSPIVRDMLDRICQWQRQHQSDVELQEWQDSFLCEPLHYQWMTQSEVLQNADSFPFSLGHNCGSLTQLFASVLQPADLTLQQEEVSIVSAAWLQQPQQQGSFGFGHGMPGPSQSEGLAGWAANADGTASASAFQHQNQLQAGYLLTNEEALAPVQLNVQDSIYAGLPALDTANAETQLAGQASAYSAGQPAGYALGHHPSAFAEGGAYSSVHALPDTYMSDYHADQDRHQSRAQTGTAAPAEAGATDEMLEPLPLNLPAARDRLGHGTAQVQGQQQGCLAGIIEVAFSCSLLACIRLCHCTCDTDPV